QRLNRIRAPDPAQGKNQLAQHRLVGLLLHRDDERHRQGVRLAAADPERYLHPHLRGLVTQRAPQRLDGAAGADLRERERHASAPARWSARVASVRCFGTVTSRASISTTGRVQMRRTTMAY